MTLLGAEAAGTAGAHSCGSASLRAGSAAVLAAVVLLAGLGSLALAASRPTAPGASVRYVDDDPGCSGREPCHTSIQQAIDSAVDGDTIEVAPGRYTETVTIRDKGLTIVGSGAGEPDAPPDQAVHSVWSGTEAGEPAVALTVDALSDSLRGVEVSGFRFVSSTVGVLLIGRRVGDPIPLPPGLPTSTLNTAVIGARIIDNLFLLTGSGSPHAGALAAYWTDGSVFEGNVVIGGAAGISLVGGGGGQVAESSIGSVTRHGILADRITDTLLVTGTSLADIAGPAVAVEDVVGLTVVGSTFTSNSEGIRVVESSPADTGSVVVGGAPESGNWFAGNGRALVLVNESGTEVSTSDVDATYNRWGTAYVPNMEEAIVHRPDDRRLGLVSYLPALEVPESVEVVADPSDLVADGESVADVTAWLRDADGGAAADDALVLWSRDVGTLDHGGSIVEAEQAGVTLGGQWTVSGSGAYGPFSGTGFVQSDVPGSTLAVDVTTDALLVRYGQSLLGAGTFRLRVDGQATDQVSTLGPDKRWVERLVAGGLGGGSHTAQLEVLTGTVVVDLLALGVVPSGAQSSVRFTAGEQPAQAHVTATVRGAHGIRADSAAIELTAGPPTAIELRLGEESLPVGGFTTTVAAQVRDDRARPVADGTAVQFSTSAGSISPDTADTVEGVAHAVFESGTDLGLVQIEAESGSAVGVGEISIVAGEPAAIEVSANPRRVPADSRSVAEITVSVWDAWDHPVADGAVVALTTTLGQIAPLAPTTESGLAHATLIAGPVDGTAVVGAGAGAGAGAGVGDVSDETTVSLEALDIKLEAFAEPRSVAVPDEHVTFTLEYWNASSFNLYDLEIESAIPPGLISPVLDSSGPPVERLMGRPSLAWRVPLTRPAEEGTITVGLRVDKSVSWQGRTELVTHASAAAPGTAESTPDDNVSQATVVVIPDAVYTVSVEAPDEMVVGGSRNEVSAHVSDRHGNPALDGTLVTFTADLGGVDPAEVPCVDGIASTTFVAGDLAGTATVRALSLEERGGVAWVRLLPGPAADLKLTSAREWLRVGGEQTPITATLTDLYGNGVVGAPIEFENNLGILSVIDGVTQPGGRLTTTLRSGVRMGQARVTARSGLLAADVTVPFRAGDPVSLDLAVEPATVVKGGHASIVAKLADEFENPVAGVDVLFSTSLGNLSPPLAATDAQGRAVSVLVATRLGAGVVTAEAGQLQAASLLTVVPERLYLPYAVAQ